MARDDMIMLMVSFTRFDQGFIKFARAYYAPIARTSLFIIYFYFGFLKLLGLSPASDLAIGFATKMGAGMYANELFIALAFIECVIGVLLLMPRFTRQALLIMAIHMVLVSAPILFYPDATWVRPFVPSLEGQYIIKNAALVALALGLVAKTKPLATNKR
jgi:uncharacterized membrane protein YphA (DoxX/SURF4 family)